MQRLKKPKEKIFCLYHKQTDCVCIHPVTDEKVLQERIEHDKRIRILWKKYGIRN